MQKQIKKINGEELHDVEMTKREKTRLKNLVKQTIVELEKMEEEIDGLGSLTRYTNLAVKDYVNGISATTKRIQETLAEVKALDKLVSETYNETLHIENVISDSISASVIAEGNYHYRDALSTFANAIGFEVEYSIVKMNRIRMKFKYGLLKPELAESSIQNACKKDFIANSETLELISHEKHGICIVNTEKNKKQVSELFKKYFPGANIFLRDIMIQGANIIVVEIEVSFSDIENFENLVKEKQEVQTKSAKPEIIEPRKEASSEPLNDSAKESAKESPKDSLNGSFKKEKVDSEETAEKTTEKTGNPVKQSNTNQKRRQVRSTPQKNNHYY